MSGQDLCPSCGGAANVGQDRGYPGRVVLTPLGERIREARTEVGLSAERLGIRAGLHPNTVQRIEVGQRTREATLTAIARALAAAELNEMPNDAAVVAQAAAVVGEWMQVAGGQVAPPSPRQERIDARRRKWSERLHAEARMLARAMFLRMMHDLEYPDE